MNPKARAHDCRGIFFWGSFPGEESMLQKPICKNFVEGSNDRYYNVS